MDIIEKLPEIIEAVSLIISGCAIIATLTPTKADDKSVQRLLNVVHFLAMNFGRAKNAE